MHGPVCIRPKRFANGPAIDFAGVCLRNFLPELDGLRRFHAPQAMLAVPDHLLLGQMRSLFEHEDSFDRLAPDIVRDANDGTLLDLAG
jgi:hypothetical protein